MGPLPLTPRDGFRHCVTDRLELRAFSLADLDVVYELMSDPRVWWHHPTGVHTDPSRTAGQLEREARGWELDGLGYWTAWHPGDGGAFVGVGGCHQHDGVVWNLYYRIRAELQGNGYATESARAAVAAARVVDPDLPVIASVLSHNAPSRAVAAAVGLRLVSERPGREGSRLLFCDRDVGPGVLEGLLGR